MNILLNVIIKQHEFGKTIVTRNGKLLPFLMTMVKLRLVKSPKIFNQSKFNNTKRVINDTHREKLVFGTKIY